MPDRSSAPGPMVPFPPPRYTCRWGSVLSREPRCTRPAQPCEIGAGGVTAAGRVVSPVRVYCRKHRLQAAAEARDA